MPPRALAAINDAGAEQQGPRSQQGGHVLRSAIATGGSAVMKFSLRPAIFLTIYNLGPLQVSIRTRPAAVTIADRGASPGLALRCGDTCGKNDMIDNKNVQRLWMIGKFSLISEMNLGEAFGDKNPST